MEDAEAVVSEQIDYYRARAAEYDEWWDRRGRYDRGADATTAWLAERDEVLRAFDELRVSGDVLELAPGTGIWTERLVRTAHSITAVDASPEMIEANRRRLGSTSSRVTYVVADLFAWTAPRRFDAVVFGFWLSHVPKARLGAFLTTVADALHEGGAVFFVDGRREPTSTAVEHVLPATNDEVMTRRLNDDSEFRIVKNFWDGVELEDRFAVAGIDIDVRETATYFQYGSGRRR